MSDAIKFNFDFTATGDGSSRVTVTAPVPAGDPIADTAWLRAVRFDGVPRAGHAVVSAALRDPRTLSAFASALLGNVDEARHG